METSNDCFVAALKKRLKEQGRGSKKKLASGVGVSPNHLSDILAGRKNAGQKLKERIADALTMSFEDMLVLGRRIAEGQSGDAVTPVNGDDYNEKAGAGLLEPNDYLSMAAEIIKSDILHSQVLINTIVAFFNALDSSNKQNKALKMIVSLQEELRTMRQDIKELKQEEGGERFSNSAAA